MEIIWPITERDEVKRLHAEIDALHRERLEVERQVRATADLAIAQRHAGQLDKIREIASSLVIRMICNRTLTGGREACQAQLRRDHDKVFSSSRTPNGV